MGDYPELLNVAELIGTPLNDNLIKDIVESATAEIETVEDLHASAAYRKRVVTELAIRALLDARDDLQRLT